MRRLILKLIPLLLIPMLLAPAGCRRHRKHAKAAEEEPAGLATMVHVADPRAAVQLIRGFHPVEANSWRWTMHAFSVTLKPPAGAAQKGASLQLKFVIPDVVIDRIKSTTCSASIGGLKLDPETYTKSGEHTYSRDVPASVLKGDAVNVEFTFDKFLAPSTLDTRELAVIVTIVGFEAKP